MRKKIVILIALTSILSCNKSSESTEQPTVESTPYITRVVDYMPAPGQYTNLMPAYEQGDTQESMNQKVLEYIGGNAQMTITLGGYGGYVVVGFDHTIENVYGMCDFRVRANAYYAEASESSAAGGSCEPGVIMVAYDANQNGEADDDEWYEIAGSSHVDPAWEEWYADAVAAGNDVAFYSDYQITYSRPLEEELATSEYSTYLKWSDNMGGEGYIPKNSYHTQSYYPGWIESDEIQFSGSRLPQNGVDSSGSGTNYVLYKFQYGYADNATNDSDASAIDIGWAVDSAGNSVNLVGVDFIKIYTGVNQLNGWLGECSTEISGVEDLHLLEIEIGS